MEEVNDWSQWWSDNWKTIVILVLLNLVLFKFKGTIIAKLFYFSKASASQTETLSRILCSLLNYTIVIFDLLILFSEWASLSVQFIAGASVLGLALGVGFQGFFQDILTGFFLIVERQLEIGDFVEINGEIKGVVEEVGLRITKIREVNNWLHYLPNRAIQRVANRNRGQMLDNFKNQSDLN